MITSRKSLLDRVSGLLLLPVIAAITLASAPVNATSANSTSASAGLTTAQTKQAQKAAKKALKAEKKATKKAAKAAAKKAKLCAKKAKKPKKARKLLARQQAAGCFANNGTGAQNGTGTEVADNGGGGSSQATGIDPTTLPLLFTPTPGNDGDATGNGEGGSGGTGASGDGGSYSDENAGLADVIDDVAPTAVPEPGTLGLLGLGLVSIGFLRRRKY